MPRVTITVPEKNSQPYRFALDRKSVSLGRGSENDIVVDCPSISVHHAVMERLDGGYQLRDLGSTNGTKFKGKTCKKVGLTDGVTVQIGDVDFDFSLSSEEQEKLAAESPDGEPPVIKEEAEEPARKKRPAPDRRPTPRPVTPTQPSSAASFFMTLLFFVLAAGAFYLGLSIRYSGDTNRSLMEDIKNGVPAAEASADDPATSEPAEE